MLFIKQRLKNNSVHTIFKSKSSNELQIIFNETRLCKAGIFFAQQYLPFVIVIDK